MATKDTKVKELIVNSMSREKFNSLTTNEKAQLSNQFVAVIGEDSLSNIVDGQGISSAQMVQDGDSGTFDFTGKNPTATSVDSTLTGQITYGATGDFATALGGISQASGKRSLAIGDSCVAKGLNSVAMGQNSVALGENSFAQGRDTTANGTGAVALGLGAKSNGAYALAIGNNTEALGNFSIALGQFCYSYGTGSIAFGVSNYAINDNEVVVGVLGAKKLNCLFSVGNGTSESARSNAFEVRKDGTVVAGGEIKLPHDSFIRWQPAEQKVDSALYIESGTSTTALWFWDGYDDYEVITGYNYNTKLKSTLSTPEKPATNTGNTHYIVEYDSYTEEFSVRQREVKHFVEISGTGTDRDNKVFAITIYLNVSTTSNNPIDSIQDLTTQCGGKKFAVSGHLTKNTEQLEANYYPLDYLMVGSSVTNSAIYSTGFRDMQVALSEITTISVVDEVSI